MDTSNTPPLTREEAIGILSATVRKARDGEDHKTVVDAIRTLSPLMQWESSGAANEAVAAYSTLVNLASSPDAIPFERPDPDED